MSEINSNEKKNNTEREHREGGNGGQNRRNSKNNYRRYHQKRPYLRNNTNAAGATAENNAVQGSNDAKPENTQRNPKTLNDGVKDSRKNPRHGGFERKKSQIRVEETIQDIDIDIGRIEKEIELEIKEIAAFKFGL